MIEIYKKSWACIVTNWPIYLSIAVAIEALPLFSRPLSADIMSLIYLTLFAYALHRHFLYGELVDPVPFRKNLPGKPAQKLGLFFAISTAMIFASTIVGFLFAPAIVPQTILSHGLGRIFVVLVISGFYLILLGIFGTTLPASVDLLPNTYKFEAGVEETLPVIGRLLLGPVLAGMIMGALTFFTYYALFTFKAFGPMATTATSDFVFGAILRLCGMAGTTLAVAVLCDAYRKIVPEVTAATA